VACLNCKAGGNRNRFLQGMLHLVLSQRFDTMIGFNFQVNMEMILFDKRVVFVGEDVAKEDVAKEDVAKEDVAKEDVAKEDVAKEDVAKEDVARGP
jgi:hypothetical protein